MQSKLSKVWEQPQWRPLNPFLQVQTHCSSQSSENSILGVTHAYLRHILIRVAIETPSPHMLRRGKPEASDGSGEAGLPRSKSKDHEWGRWEQAAWMPPHTPLHGSGTDGFSKGHGSVTPIWIAFQLCLEVLHALMKSFIAVAYRLQHLLICAAPRENQ